MIVSLAINRLNLHKIKGMKQANEHKKEVAALLEQGKDEKARIRVLF